MKEIRASLDNLFPQGSEKGGREAGDRRFHRQKWGNFADDDADDGADEDVDAMLAQSDNDWQDYASEQVDDAHVVGIHPGRRGQRR